MQTTRRTLDTGWRVREVPPPDIAIHNQLPWLPAQVPGHVHLDLHRAGVIPDPFARMHERDVAWVDNSDWVYETTFLVEEPVLGNTFLLFHGLDTVAEIALNGETLGQTDNMFIPHEFPVGEHLRVGAGAAGLNTLTVTFQSALRIGEERQDAWEAGANAKAERHWDNWNDRSFVRKAQYMYGWDWGPVLRSCGLWRPVELVTVPTARILDWKYDVAFNADETATVTVTIDVERAPQAADASIEVTANVLHVKREDYSYWDDFAESAGGHTEENVDVERFRAIVSSSSGKQTVTGSLTIDHPVLWQPNGYTENAEEGPACYFLSIQLLSGTDAAQFGFFDYRVQYIGLRTIELLHEPDADGKGEGFKFRVNGHDIYAKGANWIPNDSFPARLDNEADQLPYPRDKSVMKRILDARNANFNMLRVWGGGLYESEHFYELCDAFGILVWQDFAYGCAYYPDTGEYAEAARVEAVAAVRRIRNHPSLALWCGNNENAMMYHGNWGDVNPERYIGEHIYDDILPAVLAVEDPATPYWPSSPFGGDDPNSQAFGDCHNWDVWHGRGDWVFYPENDSRFCSEFGFAASCGLAAWETVLAPGDKDPKSAVVRWHDKTRKGYDTYLGYISLHFPDPLTLEDLVYYSQLNQAEALKCAVEHYRRRKGHNWGTLFWQFNDCWPVQSWAIVDYLGEPKAAYFAAKRFYAPVLLSLVRDGDTVTAHLTNDYLHALEGGVTLSLERFDGGETLAQQTLDVKVGANGTEAVASFQMPDVAGQERDVYLYATFQPGTLGEPVENFLLLAEPKDLRLADPGLILTVSQGSESDAMEIVVTAKRFAPHVWLRRTDGVPLSDIDDNFFHLRPGGMARLTVDVSDGVLTPDDLRARLAIRTL